MISQRPLEVYGIVDTQTQNKWCNCNLQCSEFNANQIHESVCENECSVEADKREKYTLKISERNKQKNDDNQCCQYDEHRKILKRSLIDIVGHQVQGSHRIRHVGGIANVTKSETYVVLDFSALILTKFRINFQNPGGRIRCWDRISTTAFEVATRCGNV